MIIYKIRGAGHWTDLRVCYGTIDCFKWFFILIFQMRELVLIYDILCFELILLEHEGFFSLWFSQLITDNIERGRSTRGELISWTSQRLESRNRSSFGSGTWNETKKMEWTETTVSPQLFWFFSFEATTGHELNKHPNWSFPSWNKALIK